MSVVLRQSEAKAAEPAAPQPKAESKKPEPAQKKSEPAQKPEPAQKKPEPTQKSEPAQKKPEPKPEPVKEPEAPRVSCRPDSVTGIMTRSVTNVIRSHRGVASVIRAQMQSRHSCDPIADTVPSQL